MANEWDGRAQAALAQFAHDANAGQLANTLQFFRRSSTTEDTVGRRRILDAGRPLADRAVESIEAREAAGDVVALMVETGLYLVETTTQTVQEAGVPAAVAGDKGPHDRLGPAMFAQDFADGVLLMTRGFARGRQEGVDLGMLNALRTHIVDTSAALLVTSGDFDADSKRLSLLCGIAQTLEDDLFFTQAALTLSQSLRDAHRADVAEQLLQKALEWHLLQGEQRRDIKMELASALSEQEKLAEAEALQRELLTD